MSIFTTVVKLCGFGWLSVVSNYPWAMITPSSRWIVCLSAVFMYIDMHDVGCEILSCFSLFVLSCILTSYIMGRKILTVTLLLGNRC